MSITSGPTLPLRIGKVIDGEPSEKVRLAVRSVHDVGSIQGCSCDCVATYRLRPLINRRLPIVRSVGSGLLLPDGNGFMPPAAPPTIGSKSTSPGSARPAMRSHNSPSARSSSRSSATTSAAEIVPPRASRKRARIRSFQHSPPATPAHAAQLGCVHCDRSERRRRRRHFRHVHLDSAERIRSTPPASP